MSKEQSELSKYKSPNSGDYCTAAQYISEIIITRKYEKRNIKLPFKFWNIPKYKKEFLLGIFASNRLTKIYDADLIIKVLNTSGNWITSFYGPKIVELIEEEIEKQKKENNNFNLEVNDANSAPNVFSKKTTLGKLRE